MSSNLTLSAKAQRPAGDTPGVASLPPAETLLLPALRATRRRYRLPLLPADIEAARTGRADEALAFAIETARLGHGDGGPPADEARDLFTASLAALIAAALVPQAGDPSFQALVL